jgi:galactonate dehydratase
MPIASLARRARLAPQAAVAASGPNSIANGKLFARNGYSVVKLETRGGVVGYGEGSPIQQSEFDAALARVKGREATSFEIVRTLLAAGTGVESAFNTALLDITGKLARAPIYQVLGGPTRNKARALGTITGATDDDLVKSMESMRAAGYRAFRFPAAANTPATVRRFEALRKAGGDNVDFVVDAAGAYSPGQAATLAAALEKLHPLWIDEPCSLANLRAAAKIADESVAPLGFGRHATRPVDFQEMLREQIIDVLRPDASRMSISAIRRSAAIAETYYVGVAPIHGGGRIGTAAALHLAAAIPNFVLLDIPLGNATVKDGFAELPTGPGLGIAINEGAL